MPFADSPISNTATKPGAAASEMQDTDRCITSGTEDNTETHVSSSQILPTVDSHLPSELPPRTINQTMTSEQLSFCFSFQFY